MIRSIHLGTFGVAATLFAAACSSSSSAPNDGAGGTTGSAGTSSAGGSGGDGNAAGGSGPGGGSGAGAGGCTKIQDLPKIGSFAPDLKPTLIIQFDATTTGNHPTVYASTGAAIYRVDTTASPPSVQSIFTYASNTPVAFFVRDADVIAPLIGGFPWKKIPKTGGAATDVAPPFAVTSGNPAMAGDKYFYFANAADPAQTVLHAYDIGTSTDVELATFDTGTQGHERALGPVRRR
jgi:hypothetical protein